jgi:hypothetical protein
VENMFPAQWSRLIYMWAPTAPQNISEDLLWFLREIDAVETHQHRCCACVRMKRAHEATEDVADMDRRSLVLAARASHPTQRPSNARSISDGPAIAPSTESHASSDLNYIRRSQHFWARVREEDNDALTRDEGDVTCSNLCRTWSVHRVIFEKYISGTACRAAASTMFVVFSLMLTIMCLVRWLSMSNAFTTSIGMAEDTYEREQCVLARQNEMVFGVSGWALLLCLYWSTVLVWLVVLTRHAWWRLLHQQCAACRCKRRANVSLSSMLDAQLLGGSE